MKNSRIINFVNNFYKSRRNILFLLFGIAFLIRLIVVFSIDYPFYEMKLQDSNYDPFVYHQLALSLLDGDGMKSGEPGQREYDFKRPPFYPIFLAGIYGIFGEDIFYVQGFQILIGAFTVILFYLLCLEYFNKIISFISALIFALYLPHAALSVAIMTEIWTSFFITSTLLLITKAYKQNNPTYWMLSGFSYVCLILNRQFYKFLFIFIILAIVVIYFRNRKFLFRNLIAFAIPFLMLTIPWMYYVKNVTGKIQFDSFFDKGFNKYAILYVSIVKTEEKLGYYKTSEEKERLNQDIDESWHLNNKALLIKFINHIQKHPGRFLKSVLYESQMLWLRSFVISGKTSGNIHLDLSPLMKKKYLYEKNYGVIFICFLTALFALAGIVGVLRFGVRSFPLMFILLFTVGAFTFYFAHDRYGLPVHNIIILYAVAAINWILGNVNSRVQRHRTPNSNQRQPSI